MTAEDEANEEKAHPYAGVHLTRAGLERLIAEHGGPEGLDLTGADLAGEELSSKEAPLDLHGAILQGTHLRRAHLRRAYLWGANLQGADLQGADLQGADLQGANLQGADLLAADLQGASLEGADLQRAVLLGAKLQGADLRDANLQGAVLGHAKLQEARLWNADLQGANLQGANLQGADLQGANLQGANLWYANLEGANLQGANLQGADLWDATLQGAELLGATLQGARLWRATLRGARLWRANLTDVKGLGTVRWGNYVLEDEQVGNFDLAASAYRNLKVLHTQQGLYDRAGEFNYREQECRRKAAWFGEDGSFRWKELFWPRRPLELAWLTALKVLCGYGERPLRIVGWVVGTIVGLALLYWLGGYVVFGCLSVPVPPCGFLYTPEPPVTFWDALYYSAVSFINLGYGQWSPTPHNWVRIAGVAEGYWGFFLMSLFLVTFVRRMTR